jgi:CRP-like cAMP-binding protein
MNKESIFPLLKSNSLFSDLTDEQLAIILSISEEKSISKDEYMIREGEQGKEVYLITHGKVEVLKREEKSGQQHRLSVLDPGESIGEMSFIDNSPRSASVRALEDTSLLMISLNKLSSLAEQKGTFAQIALNISKKLAERLRTTGSVTVKSLQAELEGARIRVEMGRFLFKILILLSLWIFVGTLAKEFSDTQKTTSIITIPLIITLFLVCVIQVKQSAHPPSYFGLTLNHWKRSLIEGILFTLPILVIFIVVKWWIIHHHPAYRNEPFFRESYVNLGSTIAPSIQILMQSAYVLLVPLQEFIGRGTVQTCIYSSLSGPRTTFWAILLSSLIFSAFHSSTSPLFCLAAFLGSLLWGWLYARQGSLIGPSISHALIGTGATVLNLSPMIIWS